MSKEVILTGIRANNDLTIGNYFGALMPIIDMAKRRSGEFQVNLMMADLHSFSTPTDHSQLHKQITENIRLFVAAGLPVDNDDIRLFRESFVPAHSELAHILDCFTGVGEMMRMTQYKDKSSKIGADRVSVALLNYPPLMAADVLLYQTSYVPVGEDQTQHLEYIRDIAERLNNKFEEALFTIPKPVREQHEFFGKDQGLRIKDLQDPTKKMSKSDDTGKGVIFLSEDPKSAAKKIHSATTDSFGKIDIDNQDQAGIRNLMQILSLATGNSFDKIKEHYTGQTQYGPLKIDTAVAVSELLTDLQARLAQVDDAAIQAKLESSEATMREIAGQTLLKVQKAVGLRS